MPGVVVGRRREIAGNAKQRHSKNHKNKCNSDDQSDRAQVHTHQCSTRDAILCCMTKLLTEVLRKVAELPAERQDDAAHILLRLLENDASRYRLSDDQLHEVELAIAEADSGKFASEEDVAEVLERGWA